MNAVPLTQPVYTSVNGSKYVGGLEVSRESCRQRIFLGDFCAYENPKRGQENVAPFKKQPWLLGLVIGLCISKRESSQKTYTLTVVPFPFWESRFCQKLQGKSKEKFRKGHCVAEVGMVDTFTIDKLLPVVVQLERSSQIAKGRDDIKPIELFPGAYRIFCCPVGKIDIEKSFARKTLEYYVPIGANDTNNKPTLSLLAGWGKVSSTYIDVLSQFYSQRIAPLKSQDRIIGHESHKASSRNNGHRNEPSPNRKRQRAEPVRLGFQGKPTSRCIYLRKAKNTSFYEGIEISTLTEAIDTKIQSKLSKTWSFQVGDVVAVADDEASVPNSSWFPFSRPWTPALVLSIFSDNTGAYHCDFLRLFRPSELSAFEQTQIPDQPDILVHKGSECWPCERPLILGRVVIHTTIVNQPKRWVDDRGVPQCDSTCYKADRSKLYPINTDWISVCVQALSKTANSTTNSVKKLRDMLSKFLRSREAPSKPKATKIKTAPTIKETRKAVPVKRVLEAPIEETPSKRTKSTGSTISSSSSLRVEEHGGNTCRLVGPVVHSQRLRKQKQQQRIDFFESVEVTLGQEAIARQITSFSAKWTANVGDTVAIQWDDAAKPVKSTSAGAWAPFTKPWVPGQILSIYQPRGKGAEDIFIEFRWFYRWDDLVGLEALNLTKSQVKKLSEQRDSGRKVVEVDEFVNVVQASSILGRVEITSEEKPSKKYLDRYKADDGAPLRPLLCNYIYRSEVDADVLEAVTDWTDGNKNVDGPLARGLKCPKANPGKYETLRDKYAQGIQRRIGIALSVNVTKSRQIPVKTDLPSWPKELMNLPSVVEDGNRITSNAGTRAELKEFFSAVQVPVVSGRYDPRAIRTAATTAQRNNFWTVRLGDVVCVATNQAAKQPPTKGSSSPFIAPWSVGQVTCVYREKSGDTWTQPLVELRQFHTPSEMPLKVQSWMPGVGDKSASPQLFETDCFRSGVQASCILGSVDILTQAKPENNPKDNRQSFVPSVSFACSYFFFSEHVQFQPLCNSSTKTESSSEERTSRGMNLSPLVQKHSLVTPSDDGGTKYSSLVDSPGKVSTALPWKQANGDRKNSYYLSAALRPPWHEYFSFPAIHPLRSVSEKMWNIHVGDFVALRKQTATDTGSCYPFRIAWGIGQVVSIFQPLRSGSNLNFEVRMMKMQSPTVGSADGLGMVYEDGANEENRFFNIQREDLLGPVGVIATPEIDRHVNSCRMLWSCIEAQWYMPAVVFKYGGNYHDSGESTGRETLKQYVRNLRNLVCRAIEISSIQCGEDDVTCSLDEARGIMSKSRLAKSQLQPQVQLFLSDKDDDSSNFSLLSQDSGWFKQSPLMSDAERGFEVHSEVDVFPRRGTFCDCIPAFPAIQDSAWTLRVGDVVIVRCKGAAPKRTAFLERGHLLDTSRSFPMKDGMAWSVAEIVTILKKVSQKKGSSSGNRLEIRWLYRPSEIKLNGVSNAETSHIECEEVFETDHLQEIELSNVLAPARLVSETQRAEPAYVLGMPLLTFKCCRFFSIRSKCLVPVGGLDSRLKRAKCHSSYIQLSPETSSSNPARTSVTKPDEKASPSTWSTSFQQVIQRLSLTNASTEGFESSTSLIGREEKQAAIKRFFVGCISGKKFSKTKFSLFVAGPPGVGKTASIRAAICDLKHQHAQGIIPSFEFVSLNGMELRHPSEAYSKFLGKISPVGAVPSTGKAVDQLKSMFESRHSKDQKRTIILLLDEIDYLVTPKQEVLYDFFNWSATSQSSSRVRLVMVGISNTLDLFDRLHPRLQSRIGKGHLVFKAYSTEETIEILKAKVENAAPSGKVFDHDAIVFAAKKTSVASGDIRQALHVCKIAAELVFEKHANMENLPTPPRVGVKDVVAAVKKSFNSAESKAISRCAPFEALLLISMASLRKTTGIETGGFDIEEILSKVDHLARSSGNKLYLPPPNLQETLGMLNRLAGANLLRWERPLHLSSIIYRSTMTGCGGCWPLVQSTTEDAVLVMALKDTPHSQLARKYLHNGRFF